MRRLDPLSPAGRKATADHLRAIFLRFAEIEADPRGYVASLIPHNFARCRQVVRRKGLGWRREAVASLIAVRVARDLLAAGPVLS